MLQARCCLNRWRCDGVVLYIKRLKLQTNEQYTANYSCNSQTKVYESEIFNTRTHQIFDINITLKLKGNELKIVFLGVLHIAGMSRSYILEEFTVHL